MSRLTALTERRATGLLLNQLHLAGKLLRNAQESRDAVIREEEVIEASRAAYECVLKSVARLPRLSQSDSVLLEKGLLECRLGLNRLGRAQHA